MKKRLLYFIAFLMIGSCASRKNMMDPHYADGSSFDKAIVINETHERQGIADEYAWIRKTYPGAKSNSQALIYHNKKPFDVLHITTTNGKALSVHFDISNFYGKF